MTKALLWFVAAFGCQYDSLTLTRDEVCELVVAIEAVEPITGDAMAGRLVMDYSPHATGFRWNALSYLQWCDRLGLEPTACYRPWSK